MDDVEFLEPHNSMVTASFHLDGDVEICGDLLSACNNTPYVNFGPYGRYGCLYLRGDTLVRLHAELGRLIEQVNASKQQSAEAAA